MKKLFALGFILTSISTFCQSDLEVLETETYRIEYPSTWELNQSGQMGMEFGIFSPASMQLDQFRENINLIVQDISSYGMDLTDFVNLSESQIQSMISEAKIEESEKVGDKHQIIYSGLMGQFKLKFIQHYWVIGGKAYILTFTAELDQYEKYKGIGTQIMDSFELM